MDNSAAFQHTVGLEVLLQPAQQLGIGFETIHTAIWPNEATHRHGVHAHVGADVENHVSVAYVILHRTLDGGFIRYYRWKYLTRGTQLSQLLFHPTRQDTSHNRLQHDLHAMHV